MSTNKGFFFLADALLGVVLLAASLVSISFLSAHAGTGALTLSVLERQADDALIVLDKAGDLSSLDSNQIETSLDELLPANLDWNLEVRYYEDVGGGFVEDSNFLLGSSVPSNTSVASAQREFLVFNANDISRFGTAVLKVWPE